MLGRRRHGACAKNPARIHVCASCRHGVRGFPSKSMALSRVPFWPKRQQDGVPTLSSGKFANKEHAHAVRPGEKRGWYVFFEYARGSAGEGWAVAM
eukprot:1801545-Prymnesium_polylepis.1